MRSEAAGRQAQRAESDERIEKLYEEWTDLVHFFNDPTDRSKTSTPSSATGTGGVSARTNGGLGRFAFQSSFQQPSVGESADDGRSISEELNDVFPVYLCIPGFPPQKAVLEAGGADVDGTAQLVLSVILANLRNCVRPSSKCHALELLIHLSTRWLTDETKLDRVLPFVMTLFDDPSSQVRMAAIRSCVQTLMLSRSSRLPMRLSFPNTSCRTSSSSVSIRRRLSDAPLPLRSCPSQRRRSASCRCLRR